ncbi:MAG: hypothetical protein JWO33_2186 [Caulobacteraceae bacterium]|nr:hypothetical protein [Caulobacteraceae bacterium]
MPLLVSDITVIVELERAALLERMFDLPYEIYVADLLFHRELSGAFGDRLVRLGLRVAELDGREVSAATVLVRKNGHLSASDSFAVAIGKHRVWPLVSGSAGLRQISAAEQVEAHETLWLVDELEAAEICCATELEHGLSTAAAHPRCRLPKAGVAKRLSRYRDLA